MKKVLVFLLLFFIPVFINASDFFISVEGYELSPMFDKDIHYYNVFVKSKTKTIRVKTSEEEKEFSLKKGYNEIVINNLYHINVVRGKINSNNNYGLKTLSINNYKIDFNPNVYQYYITLNKNDTELFFDYEKYNKDDTVEIINNSNFKYGNNVVKIKVSGTKDIVYTINVQKKEKENITKKTSISKTKEFIFIGLLIISILFIIWLLFYLLFIKHHFK